MVRIAPAKHTKSDPAQDRSLIDGVQWHHEVSGNFALLAGCSQHLERHDSSGGIVLPRTGPDYALATWGAWVSGMATLSIWFGTGNCVDPGVSAGQAELCCRP